MHEQPKSDSQDGDPEITTASQDAEAQAMVLLRLVELAPAQLTEAELSLELYGEHPEFHQHDALERAIQDLIGYGLAHRVGVVLIASRSAQRFAELVVNR